MKNLRLYTILGSLLLLTGLIYGVTTISVGEEAHDTSAWAVRCDEDDAGNKTYCEMYSKVSVKETGALVSEIAIGYPEGMDGPGRGVIALPLGMLLPPGGKIRVDEDGEVYSFAMQTCAARGCISIIDVKPELMDQLKAGKILNIAFSIGGNGVTIPLPLSGFKRALKSLDASSE